VNYGVRELDTGVERTMTTLSEKCGGVTTHSREKEEKKKKMGQGSQSRHKMEKSNVKYERGHAVT